MAYREQAGSYKETGLALTDGMKFDYFLSNRNESLILFMVGEDALIFSQQVDADDGENGLGEGIKLPLQFFCILSSGRVRFVKEKSLKRYDLDVFNAPGRGDHFIPVFAIAYG